ncbi:hypothetical protein KAU43_08115, partial [candidate division WOR-3 bacterium]|nr:hypothetical protein [candidate division WOR-3 bacterium]
MKKTVLLLVIIVIIFSSIKIYGFSGENPFGMNLTVPEYWFDKDSTYSFSGDSVYRNIYKGMLDSAQTMGIVWWRAQYRFRWNDVEPIPGSFVFTDEDSIVKWTSDNRMHMLPVIGNTAKWAHHLGIPNSDSVYWTRYPPDDSYWSDYTKYIKAIVERYDGDGIDDVEIPNFIPIKYWQIMNEPYGYYFLGTQDQYEYMFVKTYEAIKEADPEAKVLGPCLTSINPKDSTYQGPLWWEYYDVNGDSIANEWYNPDIKCLHWQKRIKNFLDYTTEHSVDISDIILAHHLYHLNDSINYKYLQEVIDSLDIWYPGENIPVWITETGYKWHNSITIESTNIVFNPDIIDSNFVCEKTYWFDHSKPFRHVPLIDTVLTPGESIWVNTPTKVNKWYVFNGEYIISCDTSLHDTILFPNDTIHFLHHRFMINTLQNIIDTSYQYYDSCSLLTKTLETQDNYYTGFINRIFNNPSIANRLKIFFFDLTPTIRKSPNDTFPGNVYARIIKYTDGTIKLVKSHYMSSLTLFDYINGKHYAFYTLKDSITNPPLAICNAPVITNIEYENNLLKVYWQNNSFNSSANYVGVIDTINNDTISFRYISQFAESLITDTIIIPGWYKIRVSTYMQHDTAWYSDYETYYIGDTTSPYINIQIPLNPDIAGNYHTLHWQAYDTISAIKSQKLILDNDTTNLNKDVRQCQIQKGTYNGWYNILPTLEVEDYGRNFASDSDSISVALFDVCSLDFTIQLTIE